MGVGGSVLQVALDLVFSVLCLTVLRYNSRLCWNVNFWDGGGVAIVTQAHFQSLSYPLKQGVCSSCFCTADIVDPWNEIQDWFLSVVFSYGTRKAWIDQDFPPATFPESWGTGRQLILDFPCPLLPIYKYKHMSVNDNSVCYTGFCVYVSWLSRLKKVGTKWAVYLFHNSLIISFPVTVEIVILFSLFHTRFWPLKYE